MEVANHRVVGLGHHRSVRVSVDSQDVLRCRNPYPVLDCTADSAGDVEVRRKHGASLSYLVFVWPPSVIGDDSLAVNHTPEQLSAFL